MHLIDDLANAAAAIIDKNHTLATLAQKAEADIKGIQAVLPANVQASLAALFAEANKEDGTIQVADPAPAAPVIVTAPVEDKGMAGVGEAAVAIVAAVEAEAPAPVITTDPPSAAPDPSLTAAEPSPAADVAPA